MAKLDLAYKKTEHESVDWGSILKRFTEDGRPVPEGVQAEADASEAALCQARSRLEAAERAQDMLRKEVDQVHEIAMQLKDPPPRDPEPAIPKRGTKRRAGTSEKTPGAGAPEKTSHAARPSKRSKTNPNSFVSSFDKLISSHQQPVIAQTGVHHKPQVPSGPATLSTLRAVYEVLDGLVAKGKLQRGKDLEMDENGWPKLCDDNPAPSQSRTAPDVKFESLSNLEKLGLFSLSAFDAEALLHPDHKTNAPSAK
ncbi:hypothetical protein PG985_004392 [Apiospora marii]